MRICKFCQRRDVPKIQVSMSCDLKLRRLFKSLSFVSKKVWTTFCVYQLEKDSILSGILNQATLQKYHRHLAECSGAPFFGDGTVSATGCYVQNKTSFCIWFLDVWSHDTTWRTWIQITYLQELGIFHTFSLCLSANLQLNQMINWNILKLFATVVLGLGSRFLGATSIALHSSFKSRQKPWLLLSMLQVTVSLTSGSPASLSLQESSKVGDLKALAEESFGKPFLRLVTADGRILTDTSEPLADAGLQDGDQLTAIPGQAKLAATGSAFALWCCGGQKVVTWRNPECGGDNSAVQGLKKVQQVQATRRAFAAILQDGSVVTWGNPGDGGDSSAVQDQLRNVQQIQATSWAFAAILEDCSVVTWGNPNHGGDSSAVQGQLRGVQQIQATFGAFAAILEDGSVVTWGYPDDGGDSSAVEDQLKKVQQIQATERAFAAILEDGSIVTWGRPEYGGDSSAVQDQLKNVQQIQAADEAFAAILVDGSVVAWGLPDCGGDSISWQVFRFPVSQFVRFWRQPLEKREKLHQTSATTYSEVLKPWRRMGAADGRVSHPVLKMYESYRLFLPQRLALFLFTILLAYCRTWMNMDIFNLLHLQKLMPGTDSSMPWQYSPVDCFFRAHLANFILFLASDLQANPRL